MLTIYGRDSSINVRKVLWTCHELGLTFTREDWGIGYQSPQSEHFLKMNPNGQIPVIQDEHGVLWESNSICRYLARKANRDDLLPTTPFEMANVERWMDWQSTDLNSAWRYPFMHWVRQSPEHTDAALAYKSTLHWHKLISVLDTQLAKQHYVAGSTFTLADIVIGLSINRWLVMDLPDRPILPHVSAYFERLNSREGFLLYGNNGKV